MRRSKKSQRVRSLASLMKEVNGLRPSFQERRAKLEFNRTDLSYGLRQKLDNELNSLRRLNASIEVAKTLCILKNQTEITDDLLNESLIYTWQPFLELKS